MADGTPKESWGSESNGLVCRIVPVDPQTDEEVIDMDRFVREFNTAGEVTFAVELKNVFDEPVTLLLETIRKYRPDKPQLRAWTHEVESNEVSFSVAPDPSYREPRLVWGPVKDGLQAALEIGVPPNTDGSPSESPGVLLKTPLHSVLHVKNVGEAPITFVSESPRQGDRVHVMNAVGRRVEVRDVWRSGAPIDVRWNLEPGDTAHLPVATPSLNDLDQPGKYIVHYTIRFNSRAQKDATGNVVFPAPGDWQSELDTGRTTLFLRRDPLEPSPHGEIHGRLIDDRTEEPIRGATVACGAVINDSGTGGGDNCETDSEGNYRLLPPSPGIYTVWLKKHPHSARATAAADQGILVEPGKVATSQLRVVDGRHVAGKVLDPEGQPVEHLVVYCYSAVRPQTGGVQSVRTEADGSFAFSLPPGRAYIYAMQKVDATDETAGIDSLACGCNYKCASQRPTPTSDAQARTFENAVWVKRMAQAFNSRHRNRQTRTGR